MIGFLGIVFAGVHTIEVVTVDDGDKVVTRQVRTWRDGGWIRTELEGADRDPPLTLLVNPAEGEAFALSDETRQWAVQPQRKRVGRAILAVALGLPANGRLKTDGAAFAPVAPEQPATSPLLQSGSAVVGHTSENGSRAVTLWLQPGLALTAVDFAARHAGASKAVEAALRALPGYPVQQRSVVTHAGTTLITTRVVQSITTFETPPVPLQVPEGYRQVETSRLWIDRSIRWMQEEAKRGFAAHGFDRPFVATEAQPLPPSLPSGWSCAVDESRCFETWRGVSPDPVVVDAICPKAQQRPAACPRAGLLGVCVKDVLGGPVPSLFRDYLYDDEAIAACSDGFDDGTLITP